MNLEEARKLARDAHIWAAYEWKAPGFVKTPEVERAENLASTVLELADEVERLHVCADAILRSWRAGKPPTEYAFERLDRALRGEEES